MFLIMTVCSALAAVLFLQQYQEGVREIKQGISRSDREGEAREETFVARMEDGTRVEVPVEIFSRELSIEEKQELLDQAQQEFEQTYLGENDSENAVTEDLKFASRYVDGQVMAVYESSQPQYLWDDGTVHPDTLAQTGETEPVKITVNFTCQDMQMEYVCYVTLRQKTSTVENDENAGIQNAVKEQETASRTQQTFQLPDTVDGQKVTWRKTVDYRPLFLPVVGIVLIICIQQKPLQDKKKGQKLREKELLREYPTMVMQMSLLMGAGMTAVTAWERIAGRYDQRNTVLPKHVQYSKGYTQNNVNDKSTVSLEENVQYGNISKYRKGMPNAGQTVQRIPIRAQTGRCVKVPRYLEEMRITSREIRDGGSVRRSWEAFGNRIGLASYRKFVSLLIQNMDKGTKDTAFLLGQEAELVIEEQKNRARRLGEEAGTKLLFPMLMMLMVILAVIMIPAMMSF